MHAGVLGGTGFIGKHLIAALQERGDTVTLASLRDPAAAAEAVSGCDVIVNLSGEPVAQRWSGALKAKIESSRTTAVADFFGAMRGRDGLPARYISASAVGYYGTSEVATFTEESPPGTDFLARVCIGWEREAQRAEDLGMNVAWIRTGLALGKDGGALEKILPPFRMGVGGKVASGKQWASWIHIDDVAGIFLMAIDGVNGALNATAPHPVTNAEFTKVLARLLHRPAFFSVPGAAIAAILGEGAYILTEGQRALPERTQSAGYKFKYETVEPALAAIV